MKKILVPIDFSKEAMYACKVAAAIAKKSNSEIILLHMLEIPSEAIDPAGGSNLQGGAQNIYYLKGIHKKFEEFMSMPFFEGIKLTESVIFHKAFKGVIDESKKNHVDLIVMGSQGATGLKEMLVGSNTEKVVRLSDIPVLVIKQDIDNFQLNDLIFASDFGDESYDSFHKVMDFASTFDAKLHLLYVNLPSDRFKSTNEIDEIVATFLMTADGNLDNLQHINFVSDYTVEKGVLNFANKIGADLIAVATHGRTGIAHFFEGSISEDIANHAILPVMTFKL